METNSVQTDPTLHARPEPPRLAIQDVSSWVLRVGVILSVLVMLSGLVLAFLNGGLTPQIMEHAAFSANFAALAHGIGRFEPFALMELGVVLLVLTPILRVLTATVLFATEERDRLYTAVTFLVLVMTLTSLLFIR